MATGNLNINGSSSDVLRIKYDQWISDIQKHGRNSRFYKDSEKFELLKKDGEVYNDFYAFNALAGLDTEKSVGDEVIIPHKVYGEIPFIVIGKNHDAENSLTLLTKDIVRIMPFDAAEPNNPNSDRKNYGNNRYSQSNILQWMNSEAEAGQWYTAQHEYDQAPDKSHIWDGYNPYVDKPGLLNGFYQVFKDRLVTVDKTVALNTVTDGGGSEVVSSKIFLLSRTEVGLGNENGIAEGTIYEYFSNNNTNAQRIAYPSEYCISSNEGGYTFKDENGNEFALGKPWIWWLRTPGSGNLCRVERVWWDGALDGWDDARHGNFGLRFGLVISNQ